MASEPWQIDALVGAAGDADFDPVVRAEGGGVKRVGAVRAGGSHQQRRS